MTTRTAKRIVWPLWALTLGLATTAVVLTFLNPYQVEDIVFSPVFVVGSMSFATAGALIVSRYPLQAIGWLLCGLGLALPLLGVADEYVTRALSTPGGLPATSFLAWLNGWLPVVGLAIIPALFLLFPTGRVPSPRWRPLVWLLGVAATLTAASFVLLPRDLARNYMGGGAQHLPNPTGVEALGRVVDLTAQIGGMAVLASAFISVVALILRFRRSRGEERQQLRWLAYVAATAALMFLGSAAIELTSEEFRHSTFLDDFFFTAFVFSLALGIPVACGIAILKYRLYALDIVIKKTVVAGALVVFGTVVYLAVVVGIGAAIGDRGNAALTLAAAAIVALAFQPLRARARRLADRIVYGKRATPYEVLSEFSDRMAASYSTEDVLPRMAQILGQGTGAREAGVWLLVGSEMRLAASWPPREGAAVPRSAAVSEIESLPGSDRTFPVRHRGELLGALTLAMPATEPLTPTQEKLASDLASQAGLVLRNVRLVEDLRASRRRIVAAQDERAKKLERNLHDGAQQQLVALQVKLGLAARMAGRDPAGVKPLLDQLQAEARDALDTLRDLARGIYPPLLADQGLAAALAAQARKGSMQATVHSDGLSRYPQEVEAAIYFCCLEALQNVAKYAQASTAAIELEEQDGFLVFSVTDDGVGFDANDRPIGSGLQGMSDRLAALGGELEIRSEPGAGTTVTGRVPIGT